MHLALLKMHVVDHLLQCDTNNVAYSLPINAWTD